MLHCRPNACPRTMRPGMIMWNCGWRENVDKVETLIAETLMKFSVEGPDASALDASINSMEFALREFNTGSFPRGLSFMLGAMSSWIYDRDPLGALRFEQPLAELKVRC